MQLHYFAYGSNMSLPRLQRRVPSARFVSLAVLRGYQLRFHKTGRDGSAKCDAMQCGNEADAVHGVLFLMDPLHKPRLDEAEDLGRGYMQRTVRVRSPRMGDVDALTYCATRTDPTLRPYSWYLEHVIRGAKEHRLPESYLQGLLETDTIEDPDAARHRREMSIYGDSSSP